VQAKTGGLKEGDECDEESKRYKACRTAEREAKKAAAEATSKK